LRIVGNLHGQKRLGNIRQKCTLNALALRSEEWESYTAHYEKPLVLELNCDTFALQFDSLGVTFHPLLEERGLS